MALLEILHFPDPRLRHKAKPVQVVDAEVKRIIADMFETMYQARGIGLAATQVNIALQIVVIDISEEKNQPICLINPEITHRSGLEVMEEGCLSVPSIYDEVERAEFVTVSALNCEGEPLELSTGGLLAVCIQHELDHLEGKLFVDYLSALKRQRIRKKLEKQERKTA
ncbi:peptide deformylase [Beggiatoa alba B18LD]|uniref:Peptide deformylase n=1 Tax=Beggiatoa alba B18LD TaxID=395493 RepID=I3CFD9_9GAMM|nr:peptide deformylase [Beggiatoa alba]EIJ42332.1 peptide deformylase [Beggiatoa alba B18LD]